MCAKKPKDQLTGLLWNKNIPCFTNSNCSAMALVEPKEKTTKDV